jgi:hypothetical protein
MDESSFYVPRRSTNVDADYEDCEVPYSAGQQDEFDEVSACQHETTCRAEGVDTRLFDTVGREAAAHTPDIAVCTVGVPIERNIDFSGDVDCVMTVLSHLMDSLFDEEETSIKCLHPRSDQVLRSLVEREASCGSYLVSSTCTFSIETMHVCCNRECSERGWCFF